MGLLGQLLVGVNVAALVLASAGKVVVGRDETPRLRATRLTAVVLTSLFIVETSSYVDVKLLFNYIMIMRKWIYFRTIMLQTHWADL